MKGSAPRPGWLVTERVLGSHGLGREDRSGYRAYVEGRVLELGMERGREQLEQEWKALRRGWYLGGPEFREPMVELVGRPLGRARRGSHSGAAKREHGEAEAGRLLRRGLAVLGLEERDVVGRPKGAPEQHVLAWWLCQHTTVRRRWVSERLGRGDESRVTQAIRRVKSAAGRGLKRLKGRLERAYDTTASAEA